MGRCSVCNHEKAKEINAGLLDGSLTVRKAAELYSLSVGAIGRHRTNCLTSMATKAIEKARAGDTISDAVEVLEKQKAILTGEEILGKLNGLIETAQGIIDAKKGSEKNGDAMILLVAIDKINKVAQTYVKFMDLANRRESEKELQEWREIGALIWGFLDKRGLREEFEKELNGQ